MKKILLILAAFVLIGTLASSCQLRKPLCPAYSKVEVKTQKTQS
jgi:xanthosine utilization system XapX-like protein